MWNPADYAARKCAPLHSGKMDVTKAVVADEKAKRRQNGLEWAREGGLIGFLHRLTFWKCRQAGRRVTGEVVDEILWRGQGG